MNRPSMAAGPYTRARQGLGVAGQFSGPGGTNAVTGVAGSRLDHVPHITISGQVFVAQTISQTSRLEDAGVQEINVVDIVRPITKYAVMVEDTGEIRISPGKDRRSLATHGPARALPGSIFRPISKVPKIDPTRAERIWPRRRHSQLRSRAGGEK